MSRAKYDILEDGPDVLCIVDVGEDCMSVTNDAEAVVTELAGRLNGRRLEYIDTMGERDQLLVKDGKFAGFAPIPRPCSSCGKATGDVEERYSFGIYAGKLCLKCCSNYRDNCGEGQPQGDVTELDEFERGGYDAIHGEG